MRDHELRHIRGGAVDSAGGGKLNDHVGLLLEYTCTIIIDIRLGDIWCELRWCWLLDRRVVHAKRCEDILLDVLIKGHARDLLDDVAGECRSPVRVPTTPAPEATSARGRSGEH